MRGRVSGVDALPLHVTGSPHTTLPLLTCQMVKGFPSLRSISGEGDSIDNIIEGKTNMAVEAPTLQRVYETGGESGGESIHELLNSIRGAVGTVRKSGYNEFHRYEYMTESDILDPIKNLALQFGVSIEPSVVGVTFTETFVTVEVAINYVNVYNPDDYVAQRWFYSECFIHKDKASNGKATTHAATGAVKHAVAKMFGVSDNERDGGEHGDDIAPNRRAEKKKITPPPKTAARKAPAPPVEKRTLKETTKAERPFPPERVAAAIQHAGKLEKYNKPITEDQILHVTDALKQVPINNSDPFAGAVLLAGLTGVKTGMVKDMTEGHARTVLNWLGYNIETGKLDPDKDGRIELQRCLEAWKLT